MQYGWLLKLGAFAFVVFMIAVLAWLTTSPPEDPCLPNEGDVGAAVLADEAGDQDALVNRAIIKRGACEQAPAGAKKEDD
tara:strand:- start:78693 stop:78932 length:240 start_codon:yes stop_codon:yes gene_type:complete